MPMPESMQFVGNDLKELHFFAVYYIYVNFFSLENCLFLRKLKSRKKKKM